VRIGGTSARPPLPTQPRGVSFASVPIDTHEYSLEPEPPAPRRRRGWIGGLRPLLLLIEGLGLLLLSGAFPPLPGYIMILGACVCIGRVPLALVSNSRGLQDHRQ
jgi:hypothetical protein